MTKLSNVLDGNAEAATDRRVTFLVFLFLLSIYLLLASLHIGSGDGETIYRVTRSLVEEKSFVPSPPLDAVVVDSFGEPIPPEQLRGGGPYGAWGTDGRYYAQYGVGQSLLAAPLYLLGRGFHRLTGWGAEGFVTRAAVTLLNPLALALTGGAVFCLARWLGYSRGAAVGVALVDPQVELPLCDWQSEAVGLLSFNVPDFWFVYLWFLGLPTGWLASVVLILSGVAIGTALQL